jgi:hypothetical protein
MASQMPKGAILHCHLDAMYVFIPSVGLETHETP